MSARKKDTRHGILPGDLPADQLVERTIRVDHAGEYGAVRIYEGQLATLARSGSAEAIRAMLAKEREHLARFDELVGERRVRPTVLLPVWHAAGYLLGAATGLLGERAAMACTEAIEDVIDEHYARQAEELGDDESALRDAIEEFREDEREHRDIALEHNADRPEEFELLKDAIRTGSRVAIWLSERV